MRWGTAQPKKEGWYLVTLNNSNVMPMFRKEYPAGHFTWQGLAYGSEVIASIRFPKPYKGVN